MTDAEARELARTVFDRPLVVEAGAGTGKTTTLIARICTWCIGPGWEGDGDDSEVAARVLDGVVAITFTEAAAAEMAERFGQALVEIARGEPVKGIPALPVDAELARRRARALLGCVDRLVVSTIHAFCARILGAAPAEAGLHPDHRVDPDNDLLRETALEVVVDWFAQAFGPEGELDVRRPLLTLAERGLGSGELLDALVDLGAEALPAEVLAADPWTTPAVEALFASMRTTLGGWDSLVGRRWEGNTQATQAADELRAAVKKLLRLTREAPTRATVLAIWKASEPFADDPLRGRVQKWGRGDFTQAEARLLGSEKAAAAEHSRRLLRLCDHLRHLDPDLLDAARAVLGPLLRRTQEELRRRGIVSFAQLLRGARDLLQRDLRVRARLRSGIRQLLVDEFQDTDAIQCDLVRMLALDGDPRPGLFLVGDPKQSIYGWRSADLVAYQDFVDNVLDLGGQQLSLDVNRRSVPAILDEVERVVTPVMRFDPGYQARFQRLLPHRAPLPLGARAPVEHWLSWSPGDDGLRLKLGAEGVARLEAVALANDLVRLNQEDGVAWDRIGVLLRSSGDLETYLSALRDANVPFVVERNRQYFRRREIIDAIALVRCVLEPEDTLALLTVLRSPAVGVPDGALLTLWQAQLPAKMAALDDAALEAVREVAADAARVCPAPEGWEALLVEAAVALRELRAAWEREPADRFVSMLRERLSLETAAAARHLGEYRLANLQRFYAELVQSLGAGDPQAVLRALRAGIAGGREAEEARPTDAAENAVRVMTIHKSKGLDFDHVYVLQLHKGRAARFQATGTKARELDRQWHVQLFGARSPSWNEVDQREGRIDVNERVRLLYVAMTRARDRLVLLGDWPDTPEPVEVAAANNLLDLCLSRPDLPDFGALLRGSALDLGEVRWQLAPARPVLRVEGRRELRARPALPASGEAALRAAAAARMARPWSMTASAKAHAKLDLGVAARPEGSAPKAGLGAAIGTAVHKALEELDLRASPEEALRSGRTLLEGTLREQDAIAGLPHAESLFGAFLEGPLLRRMRAAQVLARELPLLSAPEEGDEAVGVVVGTVDLLLRDGPELVVVDYKTDAVPTPEALAERAAAYALQLETYVRAVRAATGTPTRAELWFLARGEIVRL